MLNPQFCSRRRVVAMLALVVSLIACAVVRADQPATASAVPDATKLKGPQPIEFEQEVLDNGLRVIYAPLHQAPVVHVRVTYHVGSRDERPERQGFAHMFEHMMFRGSAHVAPEEHMKLIDNAGGQINAFTSYDQTTYWETIPINALQAALWLEADRMASFKVSDDIFKTERKVVSEEWRMRIANQPYGFMRQDFSELMFNQHSYRWTPIGDMDQLRAAASSELQEFFNRYYVPNNACLILAGDLNVEQTKKWVHDYLAWIPKAADVERDQIKPEPEQTEPRTRVVHKSNLPSVSVLRGYKGAPWRSDDHYALEVLGSILSGGRSGRLDKVLVYGPNPQCLVVRAGNEQLEDPFMFDISARCMPGVEADSVIKTIDQIIGDVIDKGVTDEELNRAKVQYRAGLIAGRETAEQIATALGEEAVFGGDANRANEEWTKISKLTAADVQAAAKKYLAPQRADTLVYAPGPDDEGKDVAQSKSANKATETANASVKPSDKPVTPRVPSEAFPKDYPTKPPESTALVTPQFEKGQEADVNGVKTIVMTDNRLPLVHFTLVMRAGSDAEPVDKVGLAGMTASMMSRGSAGIDFLKFSEALESRGITIGFSDGGDTTRMSVSCTTEQLDTAIDKARQMLMQPTFPDDEFKKVQRQSIAGLMQALSNPSTVAEREYAKAVYGERSALGKQSSMDTLRAVTLDDVRNWYQCAYRPDNAILVFAGDVTAQRGKELAERLVSDWKTSEGTGKLPQADYSLSPAPEKRQVVLVDNPAGQQSTIQMGVRAYDVHDDADKWPGSVAGRILSSGIESRLGKYVRAEKGYTYGAFAAFQPARHGGDFNGDVATNPDTTTPCVEAMFKVFNDMRNQNVTEQELADARSGVAGGMVMQMQTIGQQAVRRIDQILNDYPIDYWDKYPQRIAEVTADQVRAVMNKYVDPEKVTIVIVGPAKAIESQVKELGGEQKKLPMPAGAMQGGASMRRGGGAATQPTG